MGTSLSCFSDDITDDMAVDIGQVQVAAGVFERQFQIVEPQLMEECGVQIVHVDAVLDALKGKLIGLAVRKTGLESTAGDAL